MSTKNVIISKKLLAVNSLSSIFVHILNITVLIWVQQYLLRRISTDEYSLYPVINALFIFVMMIRPIIVTGTARFSTEAYALNNHKQITEITSTMMVVAFFAFLGTNIVGVLFTIFTDKILTLKAEYLWQARLMVGITFFTLAFQFLLCPFEVGLQMSQKFVLLNIINLTTTIGRILLLFIFLYNLGAKVIWVVVATQSTFILGLIARVLLSRKEVPALRFSFSRISRSMFKKLFSFSSWNLLSEFAYRIIVSSDPVILNKLGTSLDVTCFHIGSLFHTHIHHAIQVMTQPIVPALTAMHARKEEHYLISKTYLRYGRYYTWAFLFIALPVIVFSHEFIRLYIGDTYQLAALVIILLLTESLICLGNFMIYSLAIATEHIKELAIRTSIAQFFNLLLTLILVGIFKLGALGSALSTFIIHYLGAIFMEIPLGLKLAKVTFSDWLKKSVIPGYLPALFTLPLLIIIKIFYPPDNWLSLILFSGLGCCFYLLFLGIFCLQHEDKIDLIRVLNRLKSITKKNRRRR